MKKLIKLYALLFIIGYPGQTQQQNDLRLSADHFNFIVVNNTGRCGAPEQQRIANSMGKVAETNTIRLIAVGGDPIHGKGVQSVTDTEWKVQFEDIYTARSLQTIPRYVISGNHECRGSVQSLRDYSALNPRRNAPVRYFALEQPLSGGETCLLVFIDTTPLIDRYRTPAYSDEGTQDRQAQLTWLEQTLTTSKARWKIVIGHHPVFADTDKDDRERLDMQKRIAPILERRGADLYICGRINNFQHIRLPNTRVAYVVNASASRSRKVRSVEGTIFCSPDRGFSVVSVSVERIAFYMINHAGETLHIFVIPDVR